MLRLRLNQAWHELPKTKRLFLKIVAMCTIVHLLGMVSAFVHYTKKNFIKLHNEPQFSVTPVVMDTFDAEPLSVSAAPSVSHIPAVLAQPATPVAKKDVAKRAPPVKPKVPVPVKEALVKKTVAPPKAPVPSAKKVEEPKRTVPPIKTVKPVAPAPEKKAIQPPLTVAKPPTPAKVEPIVPQKVSAVAAPTQGAVPLPSPEIVTTNTLVLHSGGPIAHDADLHDAIASIEKGLSLLWNGSSIHPPGVRCRLKIVIDTHGGVSSIVQEQASKSIGYNIAARNAVAQFVFPRRFWNQALILEF